MALYLNFTAKLMLNLRLLQLALKQHLQCHHVIALLERGLHLVSLDTNYQIITTTNYFSFHMPNTNITKKDTLSIFTLLCKIPKQLELDILNSKVIPEVFNEIVDSY